MKSITFYKSHEGAELFAEPPKPASKVLPGWYKRQSAPLGEFGGTIKRCMPIFDVMTSGYIISMPCDVYVDATNPAKLEYTIPQDIMPGLEQTLFSEHLPEQFAEYPKTPSRYHKDLFRINPLYAVGTEKGYSCLFVQPFHGDPSPLEAFPAIIDTDKFISSGHFSFYVDNKFKGVIPQGTPLIQVIPFKRNAFKSKVVSFKESLEFLKKQDAILRSTFIGGYKNKFRTLKNYK